MIFLRTLALIGFFIISKAARPSTVARSVVTKGKKQVHLVAHTHDDVGWLKTWDQYYFGLRPELDQNGGVAKVEQILNSVIESLKKSPTRTFTYVEQAFFQKWWRSLPPGSEMRTLTKKLVEETRQLQFVNGGWTMQCEATPHYLDMIDQTTLGHRFLKEEFAGETAVPKIGWQLDPFGHSATQATLLSAEVGFRGLFFGRIDHDDLDRRKKEKSVEFIWRPSESLGPTSQVFSGLTGSYDGNYGPPHGFCFDSVTCHDVMTEDRVPEFIDRLTEQFGSTNGNNIMLTMGGDFSYMNAESWYSNMDKLIDWVNNAAGSEYNVFYSTPEKYLQSKIDEDLEWTLKIDDFFSLRRQFKRLLDWLLHFPAQLEKIDSVHQWLFSSCEADGCPRQKFSGQ